MLTLILPSDIVGLLEQALRSAERREIGGILMGEHIEVNKFVVRDISIHRHGSIASFFRRIEEAWDRLNRFFERTKQDYVRFNYIGEWHSHPSFELIPSVPDHRSMRDIASDASVGANFVVLMIVKLGANGRLIGTAHTYLPDGFTQESNLMIQRCQEP